MLLFPVDAISTGAPTVQLRLEPSQEQSAASESTGLMTSTLEARLRRSWGRSSAGRAPAWHAGGRGFEPGSAPSVSSLVCRLLRSSFVVVLNARAQRWAAPTTKGDTWQARWFTSRSRRATPPRRSEFWGGLFGWKFEEFPGSPGEYHMTRFSETQGGAIWARTATSAARASTSTSTTSTPATARVRRARRRAGRGHARAEHGLVLGLQGHRGQRVRSLAERRERARRVSSERAGRRRCRRPDRPARPSART